MHLQQGHSFLPFYVAHCVRKFCLLLEPKDKRGVPSETLLISAELAQLCALGEELPDTAAGQRRDSHSSEDTPPEAWRAILTTKPGEAVTGCCTVKSGYDALQAPLAAFEKKSAEDWSRRYPELSAAIRRCVKARSTRPRSRVWRGGSSSSIEWASMA